MPSDNPPDANLPGAENNPADNFEEAISGSPEAQPGALRPDAQLADAPLADAATRPASSSQTDAAPALPHGYPVFYDAERRRWPWFLGGLRAFLLLFTIGAVLLAVSVIARPLMPNTPLPKVAETTDPGNPDPQLNFHAQRQLGFAQERELTRLRQLERLRLREKEERDRRAEAFLRRVSGPPAPNEVPTGALAPIVTPANAPPVVAAFYVNWEETSRPSARHNMGALTHFLPEWMHLKAAGSDFADASPQNEPFLDARTAIDRGDITPWARSHNVAILPLLNNFSKPKNSEEGVGRWDSQSVHEVVSDPAIRANVVAHLTDWLVRERMQGINIDFEEVASGDRDNLSAFMKELYAAFRPHHLLVTMDVQAENDSYDLPELAKWNHWLIPMLYDEHAGGTEPGPVAGIDWTRRNLQAMLRKIPANKIVLGVGNHAYDWRAGHTDAEDLTYQSAIVRAKESQPDAVIRLDPQSLNPTFQYTETVTDDKGGEREEAHTVWMQDAVSVYNQLQVAKPEGIRGAALWFLGAEDPSLWTFYNRQQWNADWGKLLDEGALDTITYGGQAQIDFEGDGELLLPVAPPSVGRRTLVRDAKSGLITAQAYSRDPLTNALLLPTSYVVRRYGGTTGNVEKKICLTFDDGPDPTWTPQILDILRRYQVPATFFVVGLQAEEYPDLIRRMWDEGHEIGNHSWSHPDMFRLTPEEQVLQLNSTQRVIQAVTGHSTTLFRPPYGGDTEPQTAKEVSPMDAAGRLNYITVGEKNDPQDWRLYDLKPGQDASVQEPTQDLTKPRDYRDIVKSVVVNRSVGSIVLLHDAGGDRSRTLAALPEIITQLRALGYKFVNVSDIRGLSRARLMPVVTGNDVLLVGADRYVFESLYIVQRVLTTLFTLSILLGVSRIFLFVGLALIQRYKEKRRVFPVGFTPTVSVVIAAYNEEKVIARTIQSLLDSDYPHLEILVVDDGSRDDTSGVVARAFGDEPRVRLFRKENGGKASALNRGLASATGEIFISLDADTLFAKDTVWQLTRHFANPRIGAVSGNVRVGNAHNIWTRWQSIEYITSQNFDRRGYDLLDCITVVPGAVGALRRSAVMAVGGYTSDTLAEDTDLTWKMRRAGWRIVNDNSAMAYTEAPETLHSLAKQRFRWAFGTLQCLWKHRAALGRHKAFGLLALPSLWVYQIVFPAVSPFMDIAMLYSLFAGNFVKFAQFYLMMFGIEFLAAVIAIRMDRANPRLLPWLFLQRFVYRQLMYYVVIKSLVYAIKGGAVGWNKLERTGTARIGEETA